MCRRLPGLLLALALLAPARPAPADERSALRDAAALDEAFQQAIAKAEPSIACVLVSRGDERPPENVDRPAPADAPRFPPFRPGGRGDPRRPFNLADPGNVPESYGSGVVIDAGGLILTNYHVVQDATEIFVRLPGEKGSQADIYAADPRSDLAVLRVRDEKILPLAPLAFGDGGKVRKGQLVLTLAHPFAAGFRDGSPSASWGIVSNLRRRAPNNPRESTSESRQREPLHNYGTLIQTDARLNLGCSGGALLNLKGELIGLTTALAAVQGSETPGGYAVPINAAFRRIIDKLAKGEEVEYGFLGVTPEPSARGGVAISSVSQGSPAAEAGLNPGDVILSVNGMPVREPDDLFLAIGLVLAGHKATLEVRSGRDVVQRTAVLDKFYVPGKVIATNRPPSVRGLRVDYLSVLNGMQPTPFPRMRFAAPRPAVRGVLIREVLPDSPAARTQPMPLKVGEIITHVNGKPVTTPAAFYQAMNEANQLRGVQSPIELTLATQDPHRPEAKVTLH
jgi:serine protease Do